MRYEQINAMLLNEFLKEHKKVEQQEATGSRSNGKFEATERSNKRKWRV